MKNTRIAKIIIFALSLALLIGAAIGFSASAENESLSIVSQNVSYEGKTHLYYAVAYDNVANPEAIKLVVTYTDDEGAVQTVTVSESEEVTLKDSAGNDVVCRAFRTPGVDAKNFTKVFAVKAVLADVASAEKTYSVAEYCHQWLAYLAGVEAPSAKELKVKAACEATLAYGTKIQALLDYYPAGNAEDYPENYSYITVDGGTANGKAKLYVINGTEVTLAANAASPIAWEVTKADGTVSKISGNAFNANGDCTIAPITGKFYSNTAITGVRENFDSGSLGSTTHDGGKGNYTQFSVADGKLNFWRTEDAEGNDTKGEGYLRWNVSSSTAKKIYVFEADVKFSGFTVGTSVGKIRPQFSNVEDQITISHSGDTITFTAGNGSGAVYMRENQWCNLRIEFDITTRTYNFFIDNSYAGSLISKATGTTTSSRILFYLLDGGSDGMVEFDNVFSGLVSEGTAIPEKN